MVRGGGLAKLIDEGSVRKVFVDLTMLEIPTCRYYGHYCHQPHMGAMLNKRLQYRGR